MDEEDRNDISSLAKVIHIQFEDLKRRLEEQRSDFKERLERSDAHFDKRIERLETEFTFELKDINEKLGDKNVDIALLKKETEHTAKSSSRVVGMIAGAVSSLVVAVVSRTLGL